MKKIYFDNAATTAMAPEVFQAMKPWLTKNFGNPSSLHIWGQKARKTVEEARKTVASFLGCQPEEVIFTGCATESNNLAIKGLIEYQSIKVSEYQRRHIIVSPIEHHCVVDAVKHLKKNGIAEVTWLKVDKYGMVNPDEVEAAIKENTVLVSVMYVNNEVGTIEPIRKISQKLKVKSQKSNNKIYFHTDAVQAIQYLDCNVDKLGVDMLSMSAHKFHGPKGVGALYVRKGTKLVRQQDGGGQERRMRAGTENVAGIVGMAKAISKISACGGSASGGKYQKSKIVNMRDYLIEQVMRRIPDVFLTGHAEKRAAHIASFIIKGCEGEAMILALSDLGIAVSSGSACTSGVLKPSHVLTAMGIKPELAHGSLRISLSRYNTKEEIDYFLKVFPGVVKRLRKMNPLYNNKDNF